MSFQWSWSCIYDLPLARICLYPWWTCWLYIYKWKYTFCICCNINCSKQKQDIMLNWSCKEKLWRSIKPTQNIWMQFGVRIKWNGREFVWCDSFCYLGIIQKNEENYGVIYKKKKWCKLDEVEGTIGIHVISLFLRAWRGDFVRLCLGRLVTRIRVLGNK